MDMRRVNKVDDFDFGRLYAGSKPKFDAGTYSWPEGMSDADKLNDLRLSLQRVLDQPNGFGVCVALEGRDQWAVFGLLAGTTAVLGTSLIAPDDGGSRSYAMEQSYSAAIYDGIALLTGADRIVTDIAEASPLLATIRERRADPALGEPTGIEGVLRVELWSRGSE